MLKKKLSLLLVMSMVVSVLSTGFGNTITAYAETTIATVETEEKNENYVWLSDLTWDSRSFTRHNSIKKNLNPGDSKITLIVDGETIQFDKGIGAHATSSVIYDVSKLTDKYTKLHGYMGVDKSMNGKGSVKFTISKSENGNDWIELKQTDILSSNNNSEKIDLDISGAKYIKLDANDAGGNGNDHAVYGDIRLLKSNYNIVGSEYSDKIKNIDQYDKEISSRGYQDNIANYKMDILKREFVNRIGYHTLQSFYKKSDANKTMIDWLTNNQELLELYISAGKPEGSTAQSLQVLSDLYAAHKADVSNKTYLKMMLATSIVFGQNLRLWTGGGDYANPVERYEIYKKLYDNKLFSGAINFEELPMELLRWVFNSQIDNEEIEWLNNYARVIGQAKGKNFEYSPHPHMKYTFDYNYNKDTYYNQADYETWATKYHFKNYDLKYGTKGDHKLWMVLSEGAVCGGISKIGSNLRQVFGEPAAVIGQPGHAAFLVYSEDANGNGKWGIDNDVSGWTKSEKGERAILNWGSQSWDSYYGVSYILLAQQALNNYDKYLDAMYYNLLANSYSKAEDKLAVYNAGLKIMPYHVDLLYGKVNSYKTLKKSSAEYLKFAREVSEALAYHPVPYVDIMKLIQPGVTESVDVAQFDMLKTATLKAATTATSENTLQWNDCRNIAKGILGAHTVELASFSFDGENANKIVLNEKYDGSGISVKYSVDGGKEWYTSTDHVITIPADVLSKITAEKDIKVQLLGAADIYTIDIKETKAPTTSTVIANQYENRFIGSIKNLEFSLDNGKNWCAYASDTRLKEGTPILVRYKANGVNLQSESASYTFDVEEKDPALTYISIDNIVGVKYANEQNSGSSGKHMVDGNPNTQWHTKWNTKTEDKSYTIELKEAKDISAIEYLPSGVNGRIAKLKVEVSADGSKWIEAAVSGQLDNNEVVKKIKFNKPVNGKFVKITALTTYGKTSGEANLYVSGNEYRLFEDQSKEYAIGKIMETYKEPTVSYSTTNVTNKDVTATLNVTEGTTVDGEASKVFTTNGDHTFTFTRPDGTKGSIAAKVNCIDKVAPEATVSYKASEDGTKVLAVINAEAGSTIEGGKNIIELTDDISKVIKVTDNAGNVTNVAVGVKWISKRTDTVILSSEKHSNLLVSAPVTVALRLSNDVKVVNNNNSHIYKFQKNGTFVFELEHKETGVRTVVPIKVDWIAE
ncbi:NPCBM/NEW2 domain-containing protein [Clostridium sp.]|uniref:NPCBM/NEW2 domain-containing protein n=1 Tax=Clostridium sp. TaxID=1506 RepID=UPI002A810F00|nr:NPCBM/NEW2 domain-containing protein [Clostridium sp.]MDY4252590.1 NPCBM/NEW2 domain-containing protein [Clostridium sp.]